MKRIDLGTGAVTGLFANAASPVWSADGSRIVFTQFSLGLGPAPTPAVAALDGRAPARPLAGFGGQAHATDWSRDGRFIVGSVAHNDTMWDIGLAPGGGHHVPANDRFRGSRARAGHGACGSSLPAGNPPNLGRRRGRRARGSAREPKIFATTRELGLLLPNASSSHL